MSSIVKYLTVLEVRKMILAELNPHLRRAIRYTLEKNWHIPSRVLFDYELIYINRGSCTLRYDGNYYILNNGDAVLICPGVCHEFWGGHQNCEHPHLHFDLCCDNYSDSRYISFLDLPEMSALEKKMIAKNYFAGIAETPLIRFRDSERFKTLFYQIIDTDTGAFTPIKKAWLTEILVMLIEDNYPTLLTEAPAEGPSIAHSIRHYIDAHYSSNFTLEYLEKRYFYNQFYLEEQFRKQYGMPIMAYRRKKRMELGADLLRHNSVSRTAAKVGYASVFSFCRSFKQYFGVPPTEYIKKAEE